MKYYEGFSVRISYCVLLSYIYFNRYKKVNTMFDYFKNSFKRKIARRITKEYPVVVDDYNLEDYGTIKFANWQNPLIGRKNITQDTVNFFKKFINEGDLVIDVGSNIGEMTVPMSLLAGKKGLAIAFEASPYVFKVIEKNSQLNEKLTNIKAFNFAIADTDGDFYYTSSEASFSNGGISKEKSDKHGAYSLSQKIRGINLELFLKKQFPDRLPRISLIKIDTEGYDKEIIKSISNLLTTYHPVVISECFRMTNQEERFEHFDSLKSKGYSLFYIEEFSPATKTVPILHKEDMLKWKHFDLYAIKE